MKRVVQGTDERMIRFHQHISLGKHTFRFLSLYDVILQHTFHSEIFIGNSTQSHGFDDEDLTDRSVTHLSHPFEVVSSYWRTCVCVCVFMKSLLYCERATYRIALWISESSDDTRLTACLAGTSPIREAVTSSFLSLIAHLAFYYFHLISLQHPLLISMTSLSLSLSLWKISLRFLLLLKIFD